MVVDIYLCGKNISLRTRKELIRIFLLFFSFPTFGRCIRREIPNRVNMQANTFFFSLLPNIRFYQQTVDADDRRRKKACVHIIHERKRRKKKKLSNDPEPPTKKEKWILSREKITHNNNKRFQSLENVDKFQMNSIRQFSSGFSLAEIMTCQLSLKEMIN